jgi:hypothetical protein
MSSLSAVSPMSGVQCVCCVSYDQLVYCVSHVALYSVCVRFTVRMRGGDNSQDKRTRLQHVQQ